MSNNDKIDYNPSPMAIETVGNLMRQQAEIISEAKNLLRRISRGQLTNVDDIKKETEITLRKINSVHVQS